MQINAELLNRLIINSFMAGQKSAGEEPNFESAKAYIIKLYEFLQKEDNKQVDAGKASDECYECKYKQNVPGNSHIECTNPDPYMTGDAYGIRKGWFIYPVLFDPTWKTKTCSNFKKK